MKYLKTLSIIIITIIFLLGIFAIPNLISQPAIFTIYDLSTINGGITNNIAVIGLILGTITTICLFILSFILNQSLINYNSLIINIENQFLNLKNKVDLFNELHKNTAISLMDYNNIEIMLKITKNLIKLNESIKDNEIDKINS